jgi:hypothetical protein
MIVRTSQKIANSNLRCLIKSPLSFNKLGFFAKKSSE